MATPIDNPAAKAEGLIEHLTGDPLLQFALKIALGLLVLLIGMRVGRWLANFERRLLLRAHVDVILAEFLRNVTYAACLVVLLLSALELSGFPPATLLAVVGTAGIAIGLALKDSLAHTCTKNSPSAESNSFSKLRPRRAKCHEVHLFSCRVQSPGSQYGCRDG
jgi:hypothetical protein